MKNCWSLEADQIINSRPSFWEYRLFSQCLSESVARKVSGFRYVPLVADAASSNLIFHVASLEDGQIFATRVIELLQHFFSCLTNAIRLGPDEARACFGPPGMPGDPENIAKLADRLSSALDDGKTKAAEMQSVKVFCENKKLQVVAELYLSSAQHQMCYDYERLEKWLIELGPNIIERIDAGEEDLKIAFKTTNFLPAHEPFLYRLKTVYKLADALDVTKTISKSSIQVAFIDTETTGLAENDEPISIGVVKCNVDTNTGSLNHVIEKYYELREPSSPVGEQAFAIHGISDDALRGKRWDINRILAILDVDLIIAHNSKFEMRMLSKVMAIDAKRWSCTMTDIADIWGGESWVSLDSLACRWRLERSLPHNALADAETLSIVVSQSLPTSIVDKTVLWEIIRRHFGFQAIEITENSYCLWGYYTPNGTLVYVWTARCGEPNIPNDDYLLNYYKEKHLRKEYVVVPIKGDLSFEQALEVKDEFLQRYSSSLLNRSNIHRPVNNCGWDFHNNFRKSMSEGKGLENADADLALRCYMAAMRSVMDSGYMRIESGLIGQIYAEIDQVNKCLEHMLIKPLNRISLILCRKKEPNRAMVVLEEVKEKFPSVLDLAAITPIIKRIDKALGLQKSVN